MINRKQSLLFLNLQKFKCMETNMYTMCRLNLCVSFCHGGKNVQYLLFVVDKKGKKEIFLWQENVFLYEERKEHQEKNLLNCACNY